VANAAKLYPLSATWTPCGEGCAELALGEDLHPTRIVGGISLGTASVAAGIMPLTQIRDSDYEPGGPPVTFSVTRWLDLRTLTVLGAVRGGNPGVEKCTTFSSVRMDPRVSAVSLVDDNEVYYRFDPEARTLASTTPAPSTSGTFFATRDAAFLPMPGLSAAFFDGKTVEPIEADALNVYGSGRDELAVWKWGSVVRGWKNDGQGARDWLTGVPFDGGPLSVAPGRIAGISVGTEGARIWRTDSLSKGAPVVVGPVILPFGLGGFYAVGDWLVVDGWAGDELFNGIINLSTFQAWRIHPRAANLEYAYTTFALDADYAYLGEKEKKDENLAARKIVRYALASIPNIAESMPPVAP